MAEMSFRANKVRAFVGIRLVDLQQALPLFVYAQYSPLFATHAVREPLTVELRDLGYTSENNTPVTVVLETVAVQIDAGESELPTATCVLAVGRDVEKLAHGVPDIAAASVVHILERYLSQYVPVRVFEQTILTSGLGVHDASDGVGGNDGGEPKVLFYGFTTGPTRRGTSESAEFILRASHFLAALTFSSSLSGDVAPGSDMAAPFHTSVLNGLLPAGLPGLTPYGVLCAALAGGDAAQKDFWGMDVPPGVGTQIRSCGLKSFLRNLAQTNQFDWAAFNRADLGASRCTLATGRFNTAAIEALDRIEPFTPDWATLAGGDAVAANRYASTVFTELESNITNIRNGRAAAGSTLGVTRTDILGSAARAYTAAGYRYGVPIAFRLSGQNLRAFTPGRGFASDIAAATFDGLYSASFWELLAQRYCQRYSLIVVPMATRALVVPNQPLQEGYWQFVQASEITQWEDDYQTPVPIRGVILVSDRKAGTGAFAGGNPAVGEAAGATQQMDAAYDSCQPGAFVTRSMPTWLGDAYRLPSTFAASTMHNKPRAAVTVPWMTGPRALTAATDIINGIVGANTGAPQAPPVSSLTTGYRLAKSLYQLERTRPRTAYIVGRYRTDIAPGSIVRFELPVDKYVEYAIGDVRDATLVGRVIRVTMSINEEAETAQTAFAVSFTRSETEATDPNNSLFSDSHPFWSTLALGSPWSDSQYIRNKLANRSNITDDEFGVR